MTDDQLHRITTSFGQQGLMRTLGASLDHVESGLVQLSCGFTDGLSQQNGFFHAGVMTSLADSACGYAAMTLVAPHMNVLTVEFKVNFLRPGRAERLVATGKVIHSGRTLTVCEGSVYDGSGQKLLARMTATIMAVETDGRR